MKKVDYIGVFDSGLGGLSVLKKLINIMPNEKYIYLADSKNNPYGTKTTNEIIKLSIESVKRLLSFGVKSIVIACNTATVNSYDELSKKFPNIKLFGTFPNLKNILLNEKNQVIRNHNIIFKFINKKPIADKTTDLKNILIVSTTATKNSKFIKREIRIFKKYFNIEIIPADKIVRLVESGNLQSTDLDDYIRTLLINYEKVDDILLACTHFEFAKEIFKKYTNNNCYITSNTEIPANECFDYLKNNNLLNNEKTEINILDTLFDKNREIIYKKLLNTDKINFIYN